MLAVRREVLVQQTKHIVVFFAILLLPIALLYGYVRIVVMRPAFFERVLYGEEYDLSEKIGISPSELERILDKLFGYVLGSEDSPIVVIEQDGYRVNFYNERELKHLEDVKNIFEDIQPYIYGIVLLEVFVIAFLLKGISVRKLFRIMYCVEIFHVGFLTVALLIARKSMVLFVSLLHKALFDNNGWILNDATDRLVCLFPKVLYKEALLYFFYLWLLVVTVINIYIIVKIRRNRNGAV